LINALRDEGAAFSTIHKVYILLNACLDYAVNDGKIQKNPCALVSKPGQKTFKKKKKKIRFLTDEEISTFISLATER